MTVGFSRRLADTDIGFDHRVADTDIGFSHGTAITDTERHRIEPLFGKHGPDLDVKP